MTLFLTLRKFSFVIIFENHFSLMIFWLDKYMFKVNSNDTRAASVDVVLVSIACCEHGFAVKGIFNSC